MASVFSSLTSFLHCSSDRHDQLTQSPRTSHGFHSSHPIPDSRVMAELSHLFIATTVNPLIRNAPHLFMEPRRMILPCPGGNQGGFYGTLS